MTVNFNKEGIVQIINSINDDWDKKETIEIIINGIRIEVSMCADNAKAIEFMLKDMLISELTGEAAQGNLKGIAAEIDKRFEELSE